MKTLHGLKVRFCSSQVTAERKRGNADGGSELRAGVEPRLTRAQERVWTRGAEEGRGCVMHPVLMGRGKVPHSPAGGERPFCKVWALYEYRDRRAQICWKGIDFKSPPGSRLRWGKDTHW